MPGTNQIEERPTIFAIVLGTNGTGKSTVIRETFVIPELNRKGKVLICTPHFNEWLDVPEIACKANEIQTIDTARRIVINPITPDEDIHTIVNNFRDGLLVFDDCRAYLESLTDRTLKTLYISRRQWKLDMVAAAHGYSEMVPKFFTFATHFILFKVLDSPLDRKKYLQMDYDIILQKQKQVFEASKKNIHARTLYTR